MMKKKEMKRKRWMLREEGHELLLLLLGIQEIHVNELIPKEEWDKLCK